MYNIPVNESNGYNVRSKVKAVSFNRSNTLATLRFK